ncbi:hypothetical protein QAD02_006772 [Eretmocerus hayati]|uniref:Uncharacterized protein n=1 Tax=Eretmocerus hayati TaxID=131215 RepID=A0ACC2N1T3_9HYME|nr:hypothetical protein QAD02_006772 [Eretmocerus hayati]
MRFISLLPVALLPLVFITSDARAPKSKFCYGKDDDPYSFFGTRTSYELAHGEILRLPANSHCKPIQIWGLIRHGSRFPKAEKIEKFIEMKKLRDEIVDNHWVRGRGNLCPTDVENLKNWDLSYNQTRPGNMSTQGKTELRLLAERLKAAFPELLDVDPRNVSQHDFIFRATGEERTDVSMESFMIGLFNDSTLIKPEEPPVNDYLLLAFRNCPAYLKSRDTDKVFAEAEKFAAGPEFQKTLENVSQRLGFDYVINLKTLLLIYDACRYEKSWFEPDRLAAWCAAFTEEDIEVLEYHEDVGCYYYSGPGRKINGDVGCPPLREMHKSFRRLERKRDVEPKGIFYFAHTVTLQTAFRAFDIGINPVPLVGTNYEAMRNRVYKTSLLGPFAGNIISVFYRCNDSKVPHRVQIFVSERVWTTEGCDDGVCDWQVLKKKYQKTVDECDLSFCHKPGLILTQPAYY